MAYGLLRHADRGEPQGLSFSAVGYRQSDGTSDFVVLLYMDDK